MNKILPRNQHLIPVSFKRKLQYEGHFMREIVDRRKLEIWYEEWFKANDKHFKDEMFESDLVDEFFLHSEKNYRIHGGRGSIFHPT